MEIVKVLVLLSINGAPHMEVAVVPDLKSCREVELQIVATNVEKDIDVTCVPLPLKAIVTSLQRGRT